MFHAVLELINARRVTVDRTDGTGRQRDMPRGSTGVAPLKPLEATPPPLPATSDDPPGGPIAAPSDADMARQEVETWLDAMALCFGFDVREDGRHWIDYDRLPTK